MVIAEALSAGAWQTAHSFSLSQPAHAKFQGEMANL
jgi:hypothetical protein